MQYSPILLFTYNRPEHTKNLLDSLSKNEEAKHSTLYIFCDGAKDNATENILSKIKEVHKIANNENRFKETIVIIQEKNKGLANSIIDGVTSIIKEYGTVIVLEDDIIVSPYFLFYMNDGLDRYKNNENVGEIGACNHFACGNNFPNYFISPMAETLGWATWKNRWEKFSNDAVYLYKELEKNNLTNKFNAYGSYDMMGMLKDHIFGKVNSWAIQWQAIMVLNNWYCIHANISYTNHIESFNATHAPINIVPPLQNQKPIIETIEIKESQTVIKALKRGYSGKGDYFGNISKKYKIKKLKKLLKAILLFLIPFGIVNLFKKNKK